MSAGSTPASAKAAGPERAAPDVVRSNVPPDRCFTVSPAPMILTGGRCRLLAISGLTTTSAPPPSLMTQQSSRCSGSAITGELTTSATVTTSGSMALGLCCAWCEAATLIQASCSLVVPYWCMWRMAHIA